MYCGENPISYHDADGCIADTVWDAASLISSAVSFGYNVKNGNKKEAVFDAVGMLADTAALLLPFVPGGFGTARKAIKATKVAAEVVGATENVISGTDSVIDGIKKATLHQDFKEQVVIFGSLYQVAEVRNYFLQEL